MTPALQGEIEGVVGLVDLSGLRECVHPNGVGPAVGEEDFLRGEKRRGDGRGGLLGAGDGKNESKAVRRSVGLMNRDIGSVLDFPRCEDRTR